MNKWIYSGWSGLDRARERELAGAGTRDMVYGAFENYILMKWKFESETATAHTRLHLFDCFFAPPLARSNFNGRKAQASQLMPTFEFWPYAVWTVRYSPYFLFFHFFPLSLAVFGQQRSAKWKIEMEYYNKTFEKLISLSLSSDSATARSYAIPSARCSGSIHSPSHRLTGNGGIFIPFLFIYSRGWRSARARARRTKTKYIIRAAYDIVI